jgi:hypothetical protein
MTQLYPVLTSRLSSHKYKYLPLAQRVHCVIYRRQRRRRNRRLCRSDASDVAPALPAWTVAAATQGPCCWCLLFPSSRSRCLGRTRLRICGRRIDPWRGGRIGGTLSFETAGSEAQPRPLLLRNNNSRPRPNGDGGVSDTAPRPTTGRLWARDAFAHASYDRRVGNLREAKGRCRAALRHEKLKDMTVRDACCLHQRAFRRDKLGAFEDAGALHAGAYGDLLAD